MHYFSASLFLYSSSYKIYVFCGFGMFISGEHPIRKFTAMFLAIPCETPIVIGPIYTSLTQTLKESETLDSY